MGLPRISYDFDGWGASERDMKILAQLNGVRGNPEHQGSSISGPRAKSGPLRSINWPAEQHQNA